MKWIKKKAVSVNFKKYSSYFCGLDAISPKTEAKKTDVSVAWESVHVPKIFPVDTRRRFNVYKTSI